MRIIKKIILNYYNNKNGDVMMMRLSTSLIKCLLIFLFKYRDEDGKEVRVSVRFRMVKHEQSLCEI